MNHGLRQYVPVSGVTQQVSVSWPESFIEQISVLWLNQGLRHGLHSKSLYHGLNHEAVQQVSVSGPES